MTIQRIVKRVIDKITDTQHWLNKIISQKIISPRKTRDTEYSLSPVLWSCRRRHICSGLENSEHLWWSRPTGCSWCDTSCSCWGCQHCPSEYLKQRKWMLENVMDSSDLWISGCLRCSIFRQSFVMWPPGMMIYRLGELTRSVSSLALTWLTGSQQHDPGETVSSGKQYTRIGLARMPMSHDWR